MIRDNLVTTVARLAGSEAEARMWRGITGRVLEAAFASAPVFTTALAIQWLINDDMTIVRLAVLTGALVVALIGQYLLIVKSDLDTFGAGYDMMCDMRLAVADHLKKLPLGFFSRRRTGDLTTVVAENIQVAEELFTHLISAIAGGFANALVIALPMMIVDWRIGFVMLISVPVSGVVTILFRGWFLDLSRRRLDQIADTASRLLEYVQGIKVIRTYGLVGERFSSLKNALHQLKVISIRLEVAGGIALMLFSLLLEAAFLLVIPFSLTFYLDGSLSAVSVIVALFLAIRFYTPIEETTVFLAEATYMKRNLERVQDVLQEKKLSEPETEALLDGHSVCFEGVDFSYDGSDEKTLASISLTVREGTTTAVVGPSGSGKSTLLNLILRFYDVKNGGISIGGVDVRKLTAEQLLGELSLVSQDVYLFNDSIRGNILVGNREATEEQMVEAAKAAYAHEFITALPYGYDTMVGEGGAALSGGERQRVSIARALLKDAPILLLDEATASVDPANEAKIHDALSELMKGRTVIVIAHRLQTIRKADQIIVLERGKVAEIGSHDQLVAGNGLYSRMTSS